MNRTVVGVVLLLALLAGGIASTLGMQRNSEAISALLEQAAEETMAGQWERGSRTGLQAKELWEKKRSISAAFTDHSPMEEVDLGFSRMELYAGAGETVAFATVCMELAKQVKAIGEAHAVRWWNLL